MRSNELAEKESTYLKEQEIRMTRQEVVLRNTINEQLAIAGYHVKVGFLHLTEDGWVHEFVPPVDHWFEELQFADRLVTRNMDQWLSSRNGP